MRSALVAIFMFVGQATFAADLMLPPAEKFTLPRYALSGVDKPVPLGEIVDVTVGLANPGTLVSNLASTAVQWKVWEWDRVTGTMSEKKVREYEGGVFFGAGIQPKRLFVQAVLTHLYIVKKDASVVSEVATRTQVLSATLTIGEPGPGPDPGPGPSPGPGPAPLPDGKYGLARFAYDEAMKVSLAARVAGAKACAKAFRGVSAAVADNKIKTPEAVLKEAKTATDAELARVMVSRDSWEAFGTALQERLYGLYKDKKIATAGEFGDCLVEVSIGLEAIR